MLESRLYRLRIHVDLRSGMDRLAALVEAQTGNRPYVPNTLNLFCGRRTDRIKGLVWEGEGWLLLYKKLSESRLQWPRNPEDVGRILQTFKIKKNVEVTDNGKIII